MGASGSMNYGVASGSYIPGTILAYDLKKPNSGFGANPRNSILLEKSGSTTTITESLTIEYFQRVWDIDNSQWCYYTQTAINASPGTTDTQPNNSGNIISSSVVQILEIY